jgi:predicted phage terminase large subunit-like protein
MAAKTKQTDHITIAPQPGAQERFLACPADIAIYGGAAGSGKSFGLLMQPLAHHQLKDFRATIFRTHSTDFRKSGGLWDESQKVYPYFNARSRESFLDWTFPCGASVKMAGLKELDMRSWKSTQIALIEYEELTEIAERVFWYMLSRNRSTCGVNPYIRAACNPEYDSWVGRLIDWWIGEDGFPIKERSGVLRWFVRLKDEMYWADSKEELTDEFGDQVQPKSLTFIPATVHDNKILMESDPGYLSNLMSLNEFEQSQLLYGNWKTRPSKGTYFRKGWVEIVDCLPADIIDSARGWDRAATVPSPQNPDPDWTAGVRIKKCRNNFAWVDDVVRMRGTPFDVKRTIKNTATLDHYNVQIVIARDPGSAGVAEADDLVRDLAGFIVNVVPEVTNKLTNFKPFSSYAQAGNVKIKRAPWNEAYLNELESFIGDDKKKDDQVDSTSKAFNKLFGQNEPNLSFL